MNLFSRKKHAKEESKQSENSKMSLHKFAMAENGHKAGHKMLNPKGIGQDWPQNFLELPGMAHINRYSQIGLE